MPGAPRRRARSSSGVRRSGSQLPSPSAAVRFDGRPLAARASCVSDDVLVRRRCADRRARCLPHAAAPRRPSSGRQRDHRARRQGRSGRLRRRRRGPRDPRRARSARARPRVLDRRAARARHARARKPLLQVGDRASWRRCCSLPLITLLSRRCRRSMLDVRPDGRAHQHARHLRCRSARGDPLLRARRASTSCAPSAKATSRRRSNVNVDRRRVDARLACGSRRPRQAQYRHGRRRGHGERRRREVGKAPGEVSVPPGSRTITLRSPRYLDYVAASTSRAPASGRTEGELQPSWGTLKISAVPPARASASMARRRQGARVCRSHSGVRRVQLDAPGFKTWQSSVVVKAGETLAIGPDHARSARCAR